MQEWGFCDKENAREFSKDALLDSELEQKVISKKEAANIEFFISTSGLESYIWKGDVGLNIL